MKKQVFYRYLGTNGILVTPIHLEGIYKVKLIKLIADPDKMLSKDNILRNSVLIPEEEVEDWVEVSK